jgi:ElaA protein
MPGALTLHTAAFAELDASNLYALLRLRVDVFVVEQRCAFPELDGRDIEPDSRHLWLSGPDGAPVGCLRVLAEPDGTARISRLAVAAPHRGNGHAARLITAALDLIGNRPCRLDAQSHLAGFYGRFGFAPTGPEFLEDGIPHIPMLRAQPQLAPTAARQKPEAQPPR